MQGEEVSTAMSFLWPKTQGHTCLVYFRNITSRVQLLSRRRAETGGPFQPPIQSFTTLGRSWPRSQFSVQYINRSNMRFKWQLQKTDNSYFLKPSLSCPSVCQSEWRATRSDKLPVTSPAEQRGLNIQQLISEQEAAPGHLKGNPATTAPTLSTPSRWPAVYQLLWLSHLNIFIIFNGCHYLLLSFYHCSCCRKCKMDDDFCRHWRNYIISSTTEARRHWSNIRNMYSTGVRTVLVHGKWKKRFKEEFLLRLWKLR